MKKIGGAIALLELFLVFPAALFMTALFARNVQPPPYEPAQTARRLVDWYAARPVLGLDIFLIAMPLLTLGLGGAILLRHGARTRSFAKPRAMRSWFSAPTSRRCSLPPPLYWRAASSRLSPCT